MSFENDLQYELDTLEYVYKAIPKDFQIFKLDGKFLHYDLVMVSNLTGSITTLEIKTDRMASKTGNITIEYQCNNYLSGISTSKANVWIYQIEHKNIIQQLWILKSDLIDYIEKYSPKKISGGDKKSAKMYLINLKHFINNTKLTQNIIKKNDKN